MEQRSDGATEGVFATSSAGDSIPALELSSDKAQMRGIGDGVLALPEAIDGEPVDAQAVQELATTDEAADNLPSSSEADPPQTEELYDSQGPCDKESSHPDQQPSKSDLSVVIPSPGSSKGPSPAPRRPKNGPGSPNGVLSRVSIKPQNIQQRLQAR